MTSPSVQLTIELLRLELRESSCTRIFFSKYSGGLLYLRVPHLQPNTDCNSSQDVKPTHREGWIFLSVGSAGPIAGTRVCWGCGILGRPGTSIPWIPRDGWIQFSKGVNINLSLNFTFIFLLFLNRDPIGISVAVADVGKKWGFTHLW